MKRRMRELISARRVSSDINYSSEVGTSDAIDAVDATVVLFASEREAGQHIYDLLHHRDTFQSFYGGKYNRSKSQELQAVE